MQLPNDPQMTHSRLVTPPFHEKLAIIKIYSQQQSLNPKIHSKRILQNFPTGIKGEHQLRCKTSLFIIVAILLIMLIATVFSPKKQVKRLLQHQVKINILEEDQYLKNSILKKLTKEQVPRWYDLSLVGPEKRLIPSQFISQSAPQDLTDKNSAQVPSNFFRFNPDPQMNVVKTAGITMNNLLFAAKLLQSQLQSQEERSYMNNMEIQYYQDKYKIGKYEELPICVVIPTYNNVLQDRYLRNIKSILQQNYTNYHIVAIDDGSTDHTGEKIKSYLEEQSISQQRWRVIINTAQMKAMFNLLKAARDFCRPEEIMMVVDGDDLLVGRQVFKFFNSLFQGKNVWFVYSNFIDVRRRNIGYSRQFKPEVVNLNSYRKSPFFTSHQRAFYTSLFLKIREEDLMDNRGNYLQAANDVAICIPILEMSHERTAYIPQITYGYDSNTGINNHLIRRAQQQSNERLIRGRSSYNRLDKLPHQSNK